MTDAGSANVYTGSAVRTMRAKAIAEACDCHKNTVMKWAAEGCPHTNPGNHKALMFNLAEVTEWLHQKSRSGKPGRPSIPGGSGDQAKAKLQLTVEQALTWRAKRLEFEGNLHNREECQERHLRQIHYVRNSLLQLSRRVAPDLVGKEMLEIEAILTEKHTQILEEFSKA